MTKYQKLAAVAVDRYFRESDEPAVSLFTLSVVADRAAFEAGKKRDLFPSLFQYETILPPKARTFWDKSTGLLSVLNPYHAGAVSEGMFIPGAFDGGVDMGPDHWRQVAKTRQAV